MNRSSPTPQQSRARRTQSRLIKYGNDGLINGQEAEAKTTSDIKWTAAACVVLYLCESSYPAANAMDRRNVKRNLKLI
jgi:hypothetical protein